jgi:hypothetical protein
MDIQNKFKRKIKVMRDRIAIAYIEAKLEAVVAIEAARAFRRIRRGY